MYKTCSRSLTCTTKHSSRQYLNSPNAYCRNLHSAPEDREIVVHRRKEKDLILYDYYLASWKCRCVFWLEGIDYDLTIGKDRVYSTETHIGASSACATQAH